MNIAGSFVPKGAILPPRFTRKIQSIGPKPTAEQGLSSAIKSIVIFYEKGRKGTKKELPIIHPLNFLLIMFFNRRPLKFQRRRDLVFFHGKFTRQQNKLSDFFPVRQMFINLINSLLK